MYQEAIPSYSREQFIEDLVGEAASDIRRCLAAGAHCVQIDFTEGRLSLKLDPSGGLLKAFIDLNNRVLNRFSKEEQVKIGVHSCPGGDKHATHSASIDYELLLPSLFSLNAGPFYIQFASEPDHPRVLRVIRDHLKPAQIVFLGVTDPIDPNVESAQEIRERVLEAASYLPIEQLGTTDDCGFAPFADDLSTSRDIAFEKIAARVKERGWLGACWGSAETVSFLTRCKLNSLALHDFEYCSTPIEPVILPKTKGFTYRVSACIGGGVLVCRCLRAGSDGSCRGTSYQRFRG